MILFYLINKAMKYLTAFWNWILSFFMEEYEVTIYFPGEIVENPDGSKVSTFNPKTYTCKKLQKISEKHFKFVTVDKTPVEIKTVNPVGYDVVKTK